jgi:hypothetical protein
MKTIKLSLEAYAALGVTLLTQTPAKAQVVINDFDPDLRMMNWQYSANDDTLKIDIDANGMDDLIFIYDDYPGGNYVEVFSEDIVTSIGNGSAYSAAGLYSGDTVHAYLDWNSEALNVRTDFIWASGYACTVSYDGSFEANQYLPLKLTIDGATHYGWARLHCRHITEGDCDKPYGSPLTVFEVAYEQTPEMPIVCDANILSDNQTHDPKLVDFIDSDDFSAFHFSFVQWGYLDYEKLNLYFVPHQDSVLNFSVEQALSLDFMNYQSFSAEEIDTSGGNVLSISTDVKDIAGNVFDPNTYYSAFFMLVPQSGSGLYPSLSAPLGVKRAELQRCSLEIENIEMTYSASENLMAVSFDKDANDTDLSGYYVGILPDHVFYHSYDEVDYSLLDPEGYVWVPKSDEEFYTIELTGIHVTMYGDSILNGVAYDPVIIGIGDGYYRDLMCFAYGNVEYILSAGEIQNNVSIYQVSTAQAITEISELSKNYFLEVTDVQGKMCFLEQIVAKHQTFSFPSLPDGIYIAAIKENDVPVAVAKIILQK